MEYAEFNASVTLPRLLAQRAAAEPGEAAVQRWVDGRLSTWSWADYLERVRAVTLGLSARGIGRGDRVAVMCDARPEWPFLSLAAQSVGAIVMGIYPTNAPSELRRVLAHSGAAVFVGERSTHLAKLAQVAGDLGDLRLVVGIDDAPAGLPDGLAAVTLDELAQIGEQEHARAPGAYDELVAAGDVDDEAVLFYTSGTTGDPKGVSHSHRTLQHGACSIWGCYPDSMRVRHDTVGFLPLAHVAPAVMLIASPLLLRLVVTFSAMEDYEAALRAVRPTVVLWPPRFHEKHAAQLLASLESAPRLRRRAYAAAMAVGRAVMQRRWEQRRVGALMRAAYAAALRTVFLPLRAQAGLDRIRVSWTASAAMPPSVMGLWQVWGLDLREMYGLTETAGSVTGQYETPYPAPGNIGPVLPDPRYELRLADDGELVVRGPSLFLEYWRNPEATAEVMRDGWFHTGDLAEIDAERRVRLIGRKKDLIVTSGGKSISPQRIEVALKQSPAIAEAVVVGDGRKYLTVLLDLDPSAADLDDAERGAQIAAAIEAANADLARVEQIKDYRVLPRPIGPEHGERTPNGKVKRQAVVDNFQHLIEEMYPDDEAQAIAAALERRGDA